MYYDYVIKLTVQFYNLIYNTFTYIKTNFMYSKDI